MARLRGSSPFMVAKLERFSGRGAVWLLGAVLAALPTRAEVALVRPSPSSAPAFGSTSEPGAPGSKVERAVRDALRTGPVRVIVQLAVPEVAADRFASVEGQKAIEDAVDAVLVNLPDGEYEVTRRFVAVNALALVVSETALRQLESHPGVVGVGLDRPTSGSLFQAVPQVRLDDLHALGYTGAGVKVAVIDSGYDRAHADLSDDVVAERCFCTGCCPSGGSTQGGPGSAQDGHGHGTNVTGIVTSRGTIAPLGGAPDASIVAVKVLDDNENGSSSDLIAAMDWIRLNQPSVRVVNISIGAGLYEGVCDNQDATTQAYATAVNNLRQAGMLVTAASGNGNSSSKMSLPACIQKATSVGAAYDADFGIEIYANCIDWYTAPDVVACFSNSNSTTDIFAPGAYTTSTGLAGDPLTSSGRSSYAGTSQAAPLVAACAAVLLQAEPGATPAQLEIALKSSPIVVTDPKNGLTFPRLDCYRALASLTGCTTPVGNGAVSPQLFVAAHSRNGGKNAVGCATNDVHAWGGGAIQDFSGGSGGPGGIMLKSQAATAYFVHGGIWSRYTSPGIGGATGVLGYPTSDERVATPSPFGTTGKVSSFERGNIHWNGSVAAATWGGLDGKYIQLLGSGGCLGFPTADQYWQASTGTWVGQFEGGTLQGNDTIGYTASCGGGGSAPSVTTLAASGVGQTSATLNGSVNPNGASTTGRFEYGTDTSYGATTSAQSLGSGSSAVPMSASVGSLSCNTTYHFRAKGSSAPGAANGNDRTFTTTACPVGAPTVTTQAASGVGQGAATLNASVNPNGGTTTGYFEWGTSSAYGNTTSGQNLGSGTGSLSLSATLGNLVCATTYYFRAMATNGGGTTPGSKRSLTTSACPAGYAGYDPSLQAPRCSTVGSVCDSGSLLVGRGGLGPEPDQPNTISSSCGDGANGSFHVDESNDRIRVSTLDGTNFATGKSVRVEATVWAYSAYSDDRLDLYYAGNAANPSWTHLATLTPAGASGQTLSATYSLPGGSLQAVRARFRYEGSAAACGAGTYDDHDDLVFAVDGTAPPTVSTDYATGTGVYETTLNATVNPNGASATTRFEYGTTLGYGSTMASQALSGSTAQAISAHLTGLACFTPYYYRAVATNAGGTTHGDNYVVVTSACPPSAPTVTTRPASGTGASSTTLNALVNPNGTATTGAFEYGATQSYGSSTPGQSLGSGQAGVAMSAVVSSLACGTTYHFRAKGTNSGGTSHGGDVAVTTAACPASPPAVTTLAATTVGQSVATLNATVTPNWSATSGYFEYGPTTAYELSTGLQSLGAGSTPGPLGAVVTGLACSTTYHFRAVATNAEGRTNGLDASFVTAACPAGAAAYDPSLQAPRCVTVGSLCDSGALLMGRASLGPEPHQPNTLGASCGDGSDGTFHSDESNDRIRVATLDGSNFAPGKTVRLEATLWAYSGYASDHLELYYAVDATSPVWTPLASLAPSGPGEQTLAATYTLPVGPLQAVRARLRYNGSTAPCGAGPYDDHDDLAFAVGAAAPPAVTTGSATAIGQFGATLNGTVNPNGTVATTAFEYGTTQSYGSFVAAQSLAGASAQPISASVSGLACNTQYYFRARAANAGGTVASATDGAFATATCPPLPSITGTVTDAVSGAPLAGEYVEFFGAQGTSVGGAWADGAGVYASAELPAGTYYARARSSSGHIDQLYAALSCPLGSCSPTAGTPIVVTPGTTRSGISFQLARGGRIATTVTEGGTGLPLADIDLEFYDSSGHFVTHGVTNAAGSYTNASGLLPGTYYLRTWNYYGYVDEVYENVSCPNSTCAVTSGTPIALTPGGTATTGFALTRGGKIMGVVTDGAAGLGLDYVQVHIYDSAANYITTVRTNRWGDYKTGGLLAGSYRAVTQNSLGYVDELYDNLPCPGGQCSVASGGAIAVAVGATTNGVDFALAPGGRISGTVTDEASGLPLASVGVYVFPPTGSYVASAYTDSSGAYTVSGLPSGTYYARSWNWGDYVDELYDNVSCSGWSCGLSGGTAISVTAGTTSSGIDFGLARGGQIGGTVTDDATGLPLANVDVRLYSATGAYVTKGTTSSSGTFAAPGVPPGTYYARTSNSLGYVDELYDGIPCPAGGCTATNGTPIVVAAGASLSDIDFALAPGGQLQGTVTDGATGQPLPSVSVWFFDPTGWLLASRTTNSSGAYSINGLPSGAYYVMTVNSQGYVDELYDNIPCPGGACGGVTSGTPVAVTAGATTAGVDFALGRGGSVSGNVTAAATGQPLASVTVRIYNSSGGLVTSRTTQSSGSYATVTGLPAGTYYTRTSNTQGYLDEVYDDLPCPSWACSVTSGTPITVVAGASTAGVDFALALAGSIGGTVTDAASGAPIAGVNVRIYDSNGVQATSRTTSSSGSYLTTTGLPAGTYFARTSNSQGYVEELFDNQPCTGGACTVTAGTPITVTAGATSSASFALGSGGRVAGLVTDAATGAALAGATVRIYDQAGAQLAIGTTDAAGTYTSGSGLLAGAHFARATARGYLDRVFDGLPCPNGVCSPTSGTAIPVSLGATTPGVDFALAQAAPQTNDEIPGATAISSWPYHGSEDTRSATTNPSDPVHSCATGTQDSNSVWFRFVASFNGTAWVSTVNSNYDTVLTAYPGTTGVGPELACNDDSNGGQQSEIRVPVRAGQSYLIEVTTYGTPSGGTLHLSLAPAFVKGDLNGDGLPDLVFRSLVDGAHNKVWFMDGVALTSEADITPDAPNADWKIRGVDDFSGDARNDLVFWNQLTGNVEFWLMNGTARLGEAVPLSGAPVLNPQWDLSGTADFNGDHQPDIVWRNFTSQKIVIWTMNGTAKVASIIPTPDQAVDANWIVVAVLDYNNDGSTDFLWYNYTSGKIVTWYMNASVVRTAGQFTTPANAGDANWKVVASSDYSHDHVPGTPPLGLPDIVWRNETSGNQVVWHLNDASTRVHGEFTSPASNAPALDWTIVGPR